jgi:hypothetical protein
MGAERSAYAVADVSTATALDVCLARDQASAWVTDEESAAKGLDVVDRWWPHDVGGDGGDGVGDGGVHSAVKTAALRVDAMSLPAPMSEPPPLIVADVDTGTDDGGGGGGGGGGGVEVSVGKLMKSDGPTATVGSLLFLAAGATIVVYDGEKKKVVYSIDLSKLPKLKRIAPPCVVSLGCGNG